MLHKITTFLAHHLHITYTAISFTEMADTTGNSGQDQGRRVHHPWLPVPQLRLTDNFNIFLQIDLRVVAMTSRTECLSYSNSACEMVNSASKGNAMPAEGTSVMVPYKEQKHLIMDFSKTWQKERAYRSLTEIKFWYGSSLHTNSLSKSVKVNVNYCSRPEHLSVL